MKTDFFYPLSSMFRTSDTAMNIPSSGNEEIKREKIILCNWASVYRRPIEFMTGTQCVHVADKDQRAKQPNQHHD